jgi:hypothetical protein
MGYPPLARWKQVNGALFVFVYGKFFNPAVSVHYARPVPPETESIVGTKQSFAPARDSDARQHQQH